MHLPAAVRRESGGLVNEAIQHARSVQDLDPSVSEGRRRILVVGQAGGIAWRAQQRAREGR